MSIWKTDDSIKQWVMDKGLDISPWAVAIKIKNEGIRVPNRYNKGKVISDIINRKLIDEIEREAFANVSKAATEILNNAKL